MVGHPYEAVGDSLADLATNHTCVYSRDRNEMGAMGVDRP